MLRSFTYLITGLLISSFALSNPVDKKTARKVAVHFYQTNAPEHIVDFTIHASAKENYQGNACYYVFGFKSGGFVMVAADDAVKPVLGYSFKGEFKKNQQNPVAEAWFDQYKQRINLLVSNKASNASTIDEWNAILSGEIVKNEKTVDPLIETTWGQGGMFNDYCPSGTPAGCVATTMAQIMNFHEFPVNGVGWHMYNHNVYGTQIAYFDDGNYDYASMPNTNGNDAVAWLMYHCGVAVDMNYGPDGSSAFSPDVPYVMANYFKYDQSINYVEKVNYTDEEWKTLLKTELDNGYPVYYSGSGPGGGHAFVCDGYDNSDYFHFNWGWDGYQDGYFAIGSLNPGSDSFNEGNGAVIGIKPAATGEEDFLWVKKFSAFPYESTYASNISVVNSQVAWAIGRDGSGDGANYRTFTRTIDGGATWMGDNVTQFGTAFSMIFAQSSSVAYIAVYGTGSDNHIIKTEDGGETWTSILTGGGASSFFNVVHFFDENHGFVQGDALNGEYELYVTSDAGENWTQIDGADIPDPEDAGEYGIVGLYDAVGDTIWYSTNNGYVYKSEDRGYTWNKYQVFATSSSTNITLAFSADAQHGLALSFVDDKDKSYQKFVTEDGGETWNPLTWEGNFYNSDLRAIPGTENSFVSVGSDWQTPLMGVSYSNDGGLTWHEYADYYQNQQFVSVAMVNEEKGFAGTFCGAFSDGMWVLGETGSLIMPDFELTETDVCLNTDVTFTNISVGNIDSLLWDFGEGADPETANTTGPHTVTYTSTGNKTVSITLYVEGETFTESKADIITVSDYPEAAYEYEISAEDPYTVYFTNLSTNTTDETTYKWRFGDYYQNLNPDCLHTYSDTGMYEVKLTVSNSENCFDEETKDIYISGVSAINEFSENAHFEVFPVPASNQLTIVSPRQTVVELYNTTGQLVHTLITDNEQQTINLSDLSKGVYLLKARYGNKHLSRTIIIE